MAPLKPDGIHREHDSCWTSKLASVIFLWLITIQYILSPSQATVWKPGWSLWRNQGNLGAFSENGAFSTVVHRAHVDVVSGKARVKLAEKAEWKPSHWSGVLSPPGPPSQWQSPSTASLTGDQALLPHSPAYLSCFPPARPRPHHALQAVQLFVERLLKTKPLDSALLQREPLLPGTPILCLFEEGWVVRRTGGVCFLFQQQWEWLKIMI